MATLKNAKSYNILRYLLPSVATAVLFCIVLIIKGIYPFGAATIDFYDLSDQGTPIYLHVYDAFHGHKNLFYDLYSALSTNMTGMLGTSGISPFNLYFLFIKRENVLKCMSIFILLKIVVMSLGMYVFLEKATKVDYLFKLAFSVCYGFSGYVLLHYTSHIWFDNVAYFPFVMAGLYVLIKEGKGTLYTISMTLSLICGYYISFLFFIYIFLILGLVIALSKVKCSGNSGDASKASGKYVLEDGFLPGNGFDFHLSNLLICTIVSILLSAFILFPQISQTLSSARFTNESGGGLLGMYTGILKNVAPAYTSRWFILLNVSFSVAIILVGAYKYRREKKLLLFTIGSVIILCAELFIESINLLWHYGSYVHYPLRNGFMITFMLAYLACLYLEKSDVFLRIHKPPVPVIAIFSCICVALTAVFMYVYSKNTGLSQRKVLHILAAVMAVCAIVYVLLLLYKDSKYLSLAPVLIACELILYGFIFLGKPTYVTGYTEDPEMERNSVYMCNQLYEVFDMSDSVTNRVKNPDESLNSNYALVLRRSALSNWTALISPKLQDSARRLGYTVQYTRLLDSGGTVFSDALLGIKNIITCVPQDEKLYELIDTADIVIDRETGETDKYYYYKCKFELPWGVKLKNVDAIDFEEDDIVKLYNSIYSAIIIEGEGGTGNSDNSEICKYISLEPPVAESSGQSITQDIAVDGKQALYYLGNQVDMDDYNTTVTVNGKAANVPSISEKDNTLYPAHFNNNALYLGSFEDETVNICIAFSDTDKNGNPVESDFSSHIIELDLELLDKLCSSYSGYNAVTGTGKTSYDLTCEAEDDCYVMLPLSFDKGYSAKVNGKDETIEYLGGLFIAVPVHAGNNDIVVKFTPTGFTIGVIISIITLIVYVVLCKLREVYITRRAASNYNTSSYNKSNYNTSNHTIIKTNNIINSVNTILEKIYIFAWLAVILVMYVIPVFYTLIHRII